MPLISIHAFPPEDPSAVPRMLTEVREVANLFEADWAYRNITPVVPTLVWSPVNSPVLSSDGTLAYLIHRVADVTAFAFSCSAPPLLAGRVPATAASLSPSASAVGEMLTVPFRFP